MSENDTLFCHEGAQCNEQMIRVDNRTKLRVISYAPAFPAENIDIVFVGGLSTVLDSFGQIIHELTRDFPFHYIETRDCSSSQIEGEGTFDIETSGRDIVAIIHKLGLKENGYVLMGYSLGATMIADGYRFLKTKPRQLILLEPTPVFHYPKLGLKVAKATLNFKVKPLKPFVNWYIRNFVIDKKKDAEMVRISEKAIDSSDPIKLKKTILAISDYKVWDKLADIDRPILIIGASMDKFHVHHETMRMVSSLKNCNYIDLENNKRSHSTEAAHLIRENIKSEKKTEYSTTLS